jgi:SAM-dependent methyltransferase
VRDAIGPARARWFALSPDAPRDEFFATLRAAVTEHYLAEPGNPYRESGSTSGAERWARRKRIADAVNASGDFIDVGCANGFLLECLLGWARERGFTLRPHGIDFVPELIQLAQRRHPAHRASFAVANGYDWQPPRTYDFVRTNLEYVPQRDRVELVRRQHRAVARGGRLIVCHYGNAGEAPEEPARVLVAAGYAVAGALNEDGIEVAWCDVE